MGNAAMDFKTILRCVIVPVILKPDQIAETLKAGIPGHLPTRLHHHAYVTGDQEATRHFYEDILGIPLVALWIENEEFQGTPVVFSHAFYELADGSALAFFNFADAAQQMRIGIMLALPPPLPVVPPPVPLTAVLALALAPPTRS